MSKKPTVPMPNQLKQFPVLDRLRVDINKVSVVNSTFTVSFSIEEQSDRHQEPIDLSHIQNSLVQIIRIPQRYLEPEERLTDLEIKHGQLLHTVQFLSNVLHTERQVTYEFVEDDSIYACVFLVNFRFGNANDLESDSEFDGYINQLHEKIFFTSRTYEILSRRGNAKHRALLLGLATLTFVMIILPLALIIYMCFCRPIRYRKLGSGDELNSTKLDAKKRSIFKGNVVCDLSHQSFIRQGVFEDLSDKPYAPTLAM